MWSVLLAKSGTADPQQPQLGLRELSQLVSATLPKFESILVIGMNYNVFACVTVALLFIFNEPRR